MLEDLEDLLDLHRWAVPVTGPRRWWSGPLDVEGLATASVGAALAAARARGAAVAPEVPAERIKAAFESIGHLRVDGRPATGFAEMSGYFRGADGWLRTHANFPHHRAALCTAVGVSDREGLLAALAGQSVYRVAAAVQEHGGVAAVLRTRADWQASAEGRAVARQPWIRLTPGDRERRVSLPGLRVLDFTRVIAGPVATRFLAALGADVLRVDPPQRPELLDQYLDTGAGKRSALADLDDGATLNRVRQLAANADVVVLAYRPGSLDRFGLGPDQLRSDFPHLTVVHLDAWGAQGPWAGRRGFDSIVQAATGIGAIYGTPDGAPGALPVQALDHATGYGAAAAALALLERGGIAHLSLSRTAEALWRLPPVEGPIVELDISMEVVPSPHGVLEQVPPITGAAAPPGRYGAASLSW